MTNPAIDRITYITNLIDAHPSLYNQANLGDIRVLIHRPNFTNGINGFNCPCCLAGLTLHQFAQPLKYLGEYRYDLFAYAANILGFEDRLAYGLFEQHWPAPWLRPEFDFTNYKTFIEAFTDENPYPDTYDHNDNWLQPEAEEAVDVLQRFVHQLSP